MSARTQTVQPLPAVAALRFDLTLFGATLVLSAFGLVMVYSASAVYALGKFGSDTHFAMRQGIYLCVGLVTMYVAQRLDYHILRRWSRPLLIFAGVVLVLVLVPGFGQRVGGAQRWFRLGPLSLQPSEFAKLALIVYLASRLADEDRSVKSFGAGFLAPLLVVGAITFLTVLQPDLGTAVLLGVGALTIMFVAGSRLTHILGTALIAAPAAWFMVVGTPWRLKRLMAFFDPEGHKEGAGYQVYEALLTLGSGGLTGVGLGEGQQKLFYLPEAHTDFILAVVGQELGFVGVMLVLVLFALVLWRGISIAANAPDAFGRYLAFGFTAVLGFQACINMAVVVGVLPTKGITLPFVSYGGTSLVASCFMIGVLLSVSRAQGEPPRQGFGVAEGQPAAPVLKGAPIKKQDRIDSGNPWHLLQRRRARERGEGEA